MNRTNCNGHLITGYRAGGIKAAGTLHRLIYGTWDAILLMCQKLCRKFFFLATVQQKFYSSYCNSIPIKSEEATRSVGRSHSSDEIFVMKMERRASVIQSQYFETTQKEDDDERTDKVIAY
jgi:hypothetical protein